MPKRRKKQASRQKRPKATLVNNSETCSGEPGDSNGSINVDQPGCTCCNVHDFTKKTWMTDVIILNEGRPLHANKAILSVTSPVFREMFEPGSAHGCITEVRINRRFEDVRLFLSLMYPGSLGSLAPQTAIVIVELASEFRCSHILEECEDVFLKNLELGGNESTLTYWYLSLANKYALERLKSRAIEVLTIGMIERENKIMELLSSAEMEILREIYANYSDVATRAAKKAFSVFGGSAALRGYNRGKGTVLKRELTLNELSYRQHLDPIGLITAEFSFKDDVTLPRSLPDEVGGILWTIGTEIHADDNDVTFTVEANGAPEWIKWSCKARLIFLFGQQDPNVFSHFVQEHSFGHKNRCLTYDKLINRRVIINKMLLHGVDKVMLGIALLVKDVKFTTRK